jgi:hypothetical protein
MTDEWTWSYLDADALAMTGESLVSTGFPSQSEAESWLGEQWRQLADVGVEAVILQHEGTVVYGPMSLRAAE